MSKKVCELGVEGIPGIEKVIVEEIDGVSIITIGGHKIDLSYMDDGKVGGAYLPKEIFDAMEKAGKFKFVLSYGYRMKCLFVENGWHFLLIEGMVIYAWISIPGVTPPGICLNKEARSYFFPSVE